MGDESGSPRPAKERFRAFLSYSHADAAAARRLHARLEAYRFPRRAGMSFDGTTRDNRIGPIFRDREDFPAATDLSAAVKAALANSRALIVLCSPHAKRSPWVAKEIALFRALHPDRPILAALIEGEPAEAFPAALVCDAEPLAADLRKEADLGRLGFLKIVAGIAGVPLDTLVQRDAQRRLRSVTGVTLIALTTMLAMAVMTTMAIRSRDEAMRQRAEAEGLIEYMLTDLRTQLRRVGRLDVMTSVNQRAMHYYEEQAALGALADDSLERRARILHAMGEDDENRGDLGAALRKFGEAYRTTAEQLRRRPADTERIFNHAQSAYWLGYIAYREKNWALAEHHWRAYRALALRLVAANDRDPRWLRESGYAEGNLCTLAIDRPGGARSALGACAAALAAMKSVSLLLPNDQSTMQDLANRHAWLADAWLARGDKEHGLAERRAQLALLRPLALRELENLEVQDQWMRAVMSMSENLRDNGQLEDAIRYHIMAEKLSDNIRKADPSNDQWVYWHNRINNFNTTLRR